MRRKAFITFLAGCVAFSGCTAVRVSHRPADPAMNAAKGTLVLKAVRHAKPEKLAGGCAFYVMKNGAVVGSYSSFKHTPTVITDLDPAVYSVFISGKRMNPREVHVEVRSGEQTIVALLVAKARYASLAEDFITVTGKGLFYAGLAVAYVIFYWPIASLLEPGDEDDDSCMRCGSDPCRCPSPPPPPRKHDPKPEVKPLLRDSNP